MTDLEECTARIRLELRRIVGDDSVIATCVTRVGGHMFRAPGHDDVEPVVLDLLGGKIIDILQGLKDGAGVGFDEDPGTLWHALTQAEAEST
jgi:hypothetical protein